MKVLAACARWRLVLFGPRGLQNSLAPQLWKGDHRVLRSFGSPAVLQRGAGQAPGLRLGQPRWLGGAAFSQRDPGPQPSFESSEKFTLIYQFSGITFLRFLSRLKVLQSGIALVILPSVWYFYQLNQVTLTHGLYATGVLCFSVVVLYAISFFLQRIIGFMYLNENGTLLKVSHLTFWGKRRNFCCPVESVMTLGNADEGKNRFLLKFRQYDQKENLYFSLHLGQIVDQEGFAKVFGYFS
ncbi:transmembrane protein 186 [Python bivittatus]|uniref:Transmembrane protein 186 n=1 Tax=Python bivittatus TaxID=176946 RepID=A0A9F2R4I9_PYTBI|nr:transmembrane protein 186 [Python bivittatus]